MKFVERRKIVSNVAGLLCVQLHVEFDFEVPRGSRIAENGFIADPFVQVRGCRGSRSFKTDSYLPHNAGLSHVKLFDPCPEL